MKKVSFIFLCLLIIISVAGCAAKPVEINTTAQNYLNYLDMNYKIESSSIKKVDFKAIERYTPIDRQIKYSELSARIDEVLEAYYTKELDEDGAIRKGDTVLANIEILNNENELQYSENNVVILVCSNRFDCLLEERLVGIKSGDEITAPVNSLSKKHYRALSENYYHAYEDDTIVVKIVSIVRYIGGPETADILFEQGYPSFFEFYQYLFKTKLEETDFEYYMEDKKSFFDMAFENCKFNISEDDIKNLSLQIVKEYEQTAQSFNMSMEEYYTSILNLDRDSFFLMCTESAERQIKSVLVVGALAQHGNITVPRFAGLQKYCTEHLIEDVDPRTYAIAQYIYLENMILKQYFPDNRK